MQVIFETCPPTLYALTSGEPVASVHVNENFPLATLIEPLPTAETVKSPEIASAEFEELVLDDVEELDELEVLDTLELDELTDWPELPGVPGVPGVGSVNGWRRSIVRRTPSAHAILTVEPTK